MIPACLAAPLLAPETKEKELIVACIISSLSDATFSFTMRAAGEFAIDWGDGTIDDISGASTDIRTIAHTYEALGDYTARLSGDSIAVAANSGATNGAAISFYNNKKITAIAGTLPLSGAPVGPMFFSAFRGCTNLTSLSPGLFSGLSGAPTSSMFRDLFRDCTNLTSLPDGLFSGISGAPASNMFYGAFYGCSGLTSLPDDLFSGISGAPANYMFQETFYGCSGLTSLPDGLFSGLSGAPANYMFYSTFRDCTNLTSLPDGLFSGISGAPASSMFYGAFYGCSGLTALPAPLFGDISGTLVSGMFRALFQGCTLLTGPSATVADGTPLYTRFSSATTSHVTKCYNGCTGLSDYASIPTAWK